MTAALARPGEALPKQGALIKESDVQLEFSGGKLATATVMLTRAKKKTITKALARGIVQGDCTITLALARQRRLVVEMKAAMTPANLAALKPWWLYM